MNPRVMTLEVIHAEVGSRLPIAGLREVSFEWSGGSINVTSGEDNGRQTLLNESSEEAITINISGLSKVAVMRELILKGTQRLISGGALVFYDGAILEAQMRIASYTETGSYQDAVTFNATLEVSGDWQYTEEGT